MGDVDEQTFVGRYWWGKRVQDIGKGWQSTVAKVVAYS
jgi:hypothetical protein